MFELSTASEKVTISPSFIGVEWNGPEYHWTRNKKGHLVLHKGPADQNKEKCRRVHLNRQGKR